MSRRTRRAFLVFDIAFPILYFVSICVMPPIQTTAAPYQATDVSRYVVAAQDAS